MPHHMSHKHWAKVSPHDVQTQGYVNVSPEGVQILKRRGWQTPGLNGTFHTGGKWLPAFVSGVGEDQDFAREEPAIRAQCHQGCK